MLVANPSRWGNPHAKSKMTPAERAEAVRRYEHEHLPSRPDLLAQLPDLAGKQLACYCPLDQPCHADVLARLANP